MITFKEIDDTSFHPTVQMITDLMNHHRKLNNAPKEFWQTVEESVSTLESWLRKGNVFNIIKSGDIAGFVFVRFGGQNVAWLEDLFIKEEYRGQGVARESMRQLDQYMIEKGVTAMFVDVIPRNTSALSLYTKCGFDHLNLVQLRKNYDDRLNKTEEIDLLGFRIKKY